ncbi:hypothetical protein GPUN_2174 [Glaciecola punicea ACAM 611]|uniref:Uncharacterized protein n=1 Tax=Glaciecola punicea ACAM 611 TaxID=1121923 RepID=H5TDB2_9ALTE|nr:hypothetical protein GPUN_2174 [Glaciecola punicea ACAM 611]
MVKKTLSKHKDLLHKRHVYICFESSILHTCEIMTIQPWS